MELVRWYKAKFVDISKNPDSQKEDEISVRPLEEVENEVEDDAQAHDVGRQSMKTKAGATSMISNVIRTRTPPPKTVDEKDQMHANAAQFVGQKSSEAVGAQKSAEEKGQNGNEQANKIRKDLRIKLNDIVTYLKK